MAKRRQGTSPVILGLRLRASKAGGESLIPGWGTKILYTACCGQKGERAKGAQIDTPTHWMWGDSGRTLRTLQHPGVAGWCYCPQTGNAGGRGWIWAQGGVGDEQGSDKLN